MPKISPGIPNELLIAHVADREKLSDALWIIAPQLGMLLCRSVDQLDEDRKVGNPPPAMKPWGVKGPVRYRLGTVRDFMFGSAAEEYRNTEHARQGIERRELLGLTCFDDFLAMGKAQDIWPFTIHRGIPIDFFRSLGLSDALTDDDTCEWMTLDRYLTLRRAAAHANEAENAPSVAVGAPPSELSAAELTLLVSFFSSGLDASNKICVAGDPPVLERAAGVLELVHKAAKLAGFQGENVAHLKATPVYSRVHLAAEWIGPFHALLATHSPTDYLWFCENWTIPLQRVVLEAMKSQIGRDERGTTALESNQTEHAGMSSRVGLLVEALTYNARTLDFTVVESIFPGLFHILEVMSEVHHSTTPSSIEMRRSRQVLLYDFLKQRDLHSTDLPPLELN